MKAVAITQRVVVDPRHGERRDCLDQRWADFLVACRLMPIPVPNDVTVARALLDSVPVAGVLLTGGNNLAAYGGDAPERDETEMALIDHAERAGLPVLGVCRGMQVIQHRFGVPLRPVAGHVARQQTIRIDGERVEVNSFHDMGTTENRTPLRVWAVADDGVVKAVRHSGRPILGVMWHPERLDPFASRDVGLVRRFFGELE